MDIKWAPSNVPLHQRIETFCAAIWIYAIIFGWIDGWITYLFLLIFCNSIIKLLCLIYMGFMYIDRNSAYRGGRGQGNNWIRSWTLFKYVNNYFRVSLVKTVDLAPDRNYFFIAYPHGFVSASTSGNFLTNFTEWHNLFPGIRSKVASLDTNFKIPIFREIILSMGAISASKRSLKYCLTMSNNPKDVCNMDGYTANAVILYPGGADEAFFCKPNNYQIIIKKRKGFVKLAIQTGVPLVPIIGFGDVDLFDQIENPPGSFLRRVQEYFKSLTGLAVPILIGRGFFQYSFGIIPRRAPVTTVVGAPLEVERCENPSNEKINEIHEKFCIALNNLFENHKHKYVKNPESVFLKME